MEFNLNINTIIENDGISLWLSDDFGGSGIEVEGKTAEEVAENLLPYLIDYFSGSIANDEDYNDEDDED